MHVPAKGILSHGEGYPLDLITSYLTALGLTGVAVGMLLEALGVPCFPGGLIIIFAGFLVSQGKLDFQAVLLVAFAAYSSGSIIAYVIGRHFGEPFFKRFGRYVGAYPEQFLNSNSVPARSAGALILLGRFLPGVGNLTPYIAGLLQFQVGWFIFYNSLFTVIWSSAYIYIGMFFGNKWPAIMEFIQPRMLGLAILGALLVLVFLVLRDRRRAGVS